LVGASKISNKPIYGTNLCCYAIKTAKPLLGALSEN
jgi:hypothetical protein